ncbi:hypothetical protein [Paracoccus sp. T5]|uniref:hypothetical protein n=1 Tax=Paracoccus sp. T5 TaxID=3402161 RepID=UPI003ADAFDAE
MARQLLGTAATLALLSGPAWAQTTETAAPQGDGMTIQQCAPVITVTQTPPTVTVTLADDPGKEPEVTVTQAPPEVSVEMCPPTLAGADGAEMQAQLVDAEPQISVQAAETAELQVTRMGGGAAQMQQETVADAPAAERQPAVPSVEPLPDRAETPEGNPVTEPGPIEAGAEAEAVETPQENEPEISQVTLPPDVTQDTDNGPEASIAEEVQPVGNAATPSDLTAPSGDTAAPAEMPADDEAPAAEMASDEAAADAAAGDVPPSTGEVSAPANAIALREGNAVVDADEVMAEGMDGVSVFSADDEEIGQIGRFDTEAQAAIVSVGGFLGLGERDVALPLSDLSFQRDGEGVMRAYIAIPSEEVEELPEHQAPE